MSTPATTSSERNVREGKTRFFNFIISAFSVTTVTSRALFYQSCLAWQDLFAIFYLFRPAESGPDFWVGGTRSVVSLWAVKIWTAPEVVPPVELGCGRRPAGDAHASRSEAATG